MIMVIDTNFIFYLLIVVVVIVVVSLLNKYIYFIYSVSTQTNSKVKNWRASFTIMAGVLELYSSGSTCSVYDDVRFSF